MKNNKGYYTLEVSVIVPFILMIVIFFMSLVFTFFYKGYNETKLNQESIEKGYTLETDDLKTLRIDNVFNKKQTVIYQKRVDDHFLKGLRIQETMTFAKDWLDE